MIFILFFQSVQLENQDIMACCRNVAACGYPGSTLVLAGTYALYVRTAWWAACADGVCATTAKRLQAQALFTTPM
jgi:hypothetical protein